jgi:hypothetical protein
MHTLQTPLYNDNATASAIGTLTKLSGFLNARKFLQFWAEVNTPPDLASHSSEQAADEKLYIYI